MPDYPQQLDFTVSNNATWDVRVTLTNNDGTPMNLAGMTMQMQLRLTPTDGDIALPLSSANARLTIVDEDAGIVGIAVSAADAATVAAGTYVYDLLVTLPDDPRVWRPLKGTVTVDEGVTR